MNFFFLSITEEEDEKKFILNLYQQYYPLMKHRAYSIVKDYGIVDDLIQEAFVKLIPKIPLLQSLTTYKLTSYIVYTMKHVCLDYIRKETRRAQHAFYGERDDVADQIPDLQAATEENYMQFEEFEVLEQALLQLSERDRNLLFFKYNMELSDKEIERLLGIPAQHVRQYIARARRRALNTLNTLSEGGNHRVEEE